MNASTIFGLLIVLFIGIVLAAGFASGNMPNNLRGLDARRDTEPVAFWFFAGSYLMFAMFGVAVVIVNWGK